MTDSTRRAAPRVDEANQCIWRGGERFELTPKAFLVLRCLMQRPDQIVSKNELLEAAWPDTHVMEGVLKVAINQLRDALGDDSQQPQFIETVHRRGYRWIGAGKAPATPALSPSLHPVPPLCVGREPALAQLEQALTRAAAGSRQLVFVTGDPGIGKSTVLDAFAARVATEGAETAAQPLLVAYGQCVDGYGTSDAYLPLLQALGQLCRQSTGDESVELLRRLAPTWLLQLPQLLEKAERDELRLSLAGSSSERMVHDLLVFVEALTARRTLVLVLEDLHWCDHATVGALAALATRREPARLMIVASYRTAEAIAQLHPVIRLKHELTSKRQCHEIVLEGLEIDAIDTYLADRFSNHRLPARLSAILQEQTSGNPLFMFNALEDFVQHGRLQERDGAWECTVDLALLADAVPDSTREMIGYRLQQLSASDLDLLEAASVIGPDFPTQALAAVLEREPAAVEIDCRRLARAAQFLDEGERVDWLDGQSGVQYAFRHSLYRQVLYARVTPARGQGLHRRFAESLEKGFASQARTLASQLSHHFELGGNFRRAVEYRRRAADRALNLFAYPQAIEHLRAGVDIVPRLPPGAERDAMELSLQGDLLIPLYAVVGSNHRVLSETIERISALSRAGGPTTPELFRALATLVSTHATRGEMRAARAVSEQLLECSDGELLTTIARGILGFCELFQGEIEAGTKDLEQSSGLPELPGPLDPGIVATADAALGRCLLGQPSQAHHLLGMATQRAAASKHPTTIVHVALGALRNGAVLLDDRLVEQSIRAIASLPVTFDQRWLAWTEIGEGWLEIRRGEEAGIERIQHARQRLIAIGMRGYQSMFASMAATGLLRAGRHDECNALLDEGLTLVAETGECWCEAELHRLCAELKLARVAQEQPATTPWRQLADEAETSLRRALEVARAQGAKWWELRAAVTLARLLSQSDRTVEARQLVSDAYGGFDDGLDLPDLNAAQELLKSLGD